MTNVIITGGTGAIGKRLCHFLIEKGYSVTIFTRSVSSKRNNVKNVAFVKWDVESGVIDKDAIQHADYIINLAGASVAEKKWTAARKSEILQSRTKSGDLLVKALKEIPNKIRAVISASASGYYGPDNLLSLNDGFTEDDPASNDFLADVCKKWEESIQPVIESGKRLVILRTGIVLSKKGGAYTEFVKPLKFRIAAILGSGQQITSWIHEDDICNMYIHAMENETLSGVYNAVAPNPVTNKELIYAIARTKYKWFIPIVAPSFILNMMLGEMATEVLKSSNLSAKKIEIEGFNFKFPEIKAATIDLSNRS